MFPGFDPSKMDPKTLLELSQLVRELPPENLNRLQSIMHNMGAGYDVKRDLEEFEKSLPTSFREKMAAMMLKIQTNSQTATETTLSQATEGASGEIHSRPDDSRPTDLPGSIRDARLTVLRAVADGRMSPADAERALFPET